MREVDKDFWKGEGDAKCRVSIVGCETRWCLCGGLRLVVVPVMVWHVVRTKILALLTMTGMGGCVCQRLRHCI